MSGPHGYGASPKPIPPGAGRLVIDCSYTPMAFMLGLTGPSVTINGRPVRAAWGPTLVDVPPGQHHVRIGTRYLGTIGLAQAMVPVGPGQQVPVFYRCPALIFLDGAIGPVPQRTPGMIVNYIALGLIGLAMIVGLISIIAALAAA